MISRWVNHSVIFDWAWAGLGCTWDFVGVIAIET